MPDIMDAGQVWLLWVISSNYGPGWPNI